MSAPAVTTYRAALMSSRYSARTSTCSPSGGGHVSVGRPISISTYGDCNRGCPGSGGLAGSSLSGPLEPPRPLASRNWRTKSCAPHWSHGRVTAVTRAVIGLHPPPHWPTCISTLGRTASARAFRASEAAAELWFAARHAKNALAAAASPPSAPPTPSIQNGVVSMGMSLRGATEQGIETGSVLPFPAARTGGWGSSSSQRAARLDAGVPAWRRNTSVIGYLT